MNKLLALVLTLALGVASASAMACPKGQELTGGTGKHHKGGTCVTKVVKESAKTEAKESAKVEAKESAKVEAKEMAKPAKDTKPAEPAKK